MFLRLLFLNAAIERTIDEEVTMKVRKEMVWMGAKVGAVIGVLLFLVCGITYAFYLCGFGILTLVSSLTGGPVQPTSLVTIVSVVSIPLGIAFFALLCGVVGAMFTGVVGFAIEFVAPVSAAVRINGDRTVQIEPKSLELLEKIEADLLVDTRGQSCPLPIINLEKAMRGLPRGNVVEVHSTCPAFLGELKAWCHRTGNKLLAFYIQSNLSVATVEKA